MNLDGEWVINRKLGHKKAMAILVRCKAAGIPVYESTWQKCVDPDYPHLCRTVGHKTVNQAQSRYLYLYQQRVSYKEVMDALEERIKQQSDGSDKTVGDQ